MTQSNLGTGYSNRIKDDRTENLEQAIAFYQQSLELEENIGNVQGQAVTFHQLAISC